VHRAAEPQGAWRTLSRPLSAKPALRLEDCVAVVGSLVLASALLAKPGAEESSRQRCPLDPPAAMFR
jgi:hypothetical protein